MLAGGVVAVSVGTGTHRLGFQCLCGPGGAHLPDNDSLYIILQANDIAHRQVAAAHPLVLKAAVVGVAPENGLGLDAVVQAGLDAQALGGAVKLKEDLAGARLDHRHPGAGGTNHLGVPKAKAGLGGLGRFLVQVGPHSCLPRPVDPGHEAAGIGGGRSGSLVVGAVAAGQLQMPAAHGDIGGNGVVIAAPCPHLAVVDILGFDHRDGGLTGGGQLLKHPVVVIIAQPVPAAHIVEQVGARQGVGAVKDTHFNGGIHRHRGGGGRRLAQWKGNGQGQGCNLHNFFHLSRFHLAEIPSRFR